MTIKSTLSPTRRRVPKVKDGKLVGHLACRQILKAIKDFTGKTDPSERWEYGSGCLFT